jgi:hypothetical protein
MIKSIDSVDDVKEFFDSIIGEGTEIHPDDIFENIINLKSAKSAYSKSEAALRNNLMEQSFEICQKYSVDIYDLSMTICLKKTGLDKLIPLPEVA